MDSYSSRKDLQKQVEKETTRVDRQGRVIKDTTKMTQEKRKPAKPAKKKSWYERLLD